MGNQPHGKEKAPRLGVTNQSGAFVRLLPESFDVLE
jgi:hypothetical protein